MSGEADWAYLPKLVAYSVLDKFFEAIDRIRFGVVCTNWHLIAKEYKEDRSVHQNHKKLLPMLMIPATNNHNKRRLYSISEGKIYGIHLSVPNEICVGSCYGWLAFANDKTLQIRLMNPFKKDSTIYLPPLEIEPWAWENPGFKIKKVILSADPSVCSNNYVVLIIYGGSRELRFFKSAQNKWGKIDRDLITLYTDVICYKNIFYAVTNYSGIVSFDLNNIDDYDKPVRLNVLNEGDDGPRVPRVYLTESSKGDLLMVHRCFVDNKVEGDKFRITKSIKVYKLVLDATSRALIERVEMASLGGDAVFVGFNYSWCIAASEFPKCNPNSIYFTNNFYHLYNSMDGSCDLGFYDMKEESFREHYKFKACDIHFNPSIWVLPPVSL